MARASGSDDMVRTATGVGLLGAATVLYELLLARIFSVSMAYHHSFFAISIGVLGMTAGGAYVNLRRGEFAPHQLRNWLASSAIAMALSIPAAFVVLLAIPFHFTRSLTGLVTVLVFCVIVAVPFFWSGVAACLALTRLLPGAPPYYAAQLAGSAAGGVLLVPMLHAIDAVSAVFVAAALAAVGAAAMPSPAVGRRVAPALAFGLLLVAVVNALGVRAGLPVLHLHWVKGGSEGPALWERWNAYSRVRIQGDSSRLETPQGWGFSPSYANSARVRQLTFTIDAYAVSPMLGFSGDLAEAAFLRHDVVNAVHHLRRPGKALVLGMGAGRDVLSARVFGHREIVGVEYNSAIFRAVTGDFGSFAGHLERLPGVRMVNDEARSWLARSAERFDVIQVTLIHTWAGTATGMLALAENSLYTREAWSLMLDRLSPEGVVAFSWWFPGGNSLEAYRSASLGRDVLEARGIASPGQHIMMLEAPAGHTTESTRHEYRVGTMLMSLRPFTPDEARRVRELAAREGFAVIQTPEGTDDSVLRRVLWTPGWRSFVADYPYDIEPTGDDRPYFFNMLRLGSVLRGSSGRLGAADIDLKAMVMLGMLFGMVTCLAVACIVVARFGNALPASKASRTSSVIFFAAIGVGFMLIEMAMLQRLIVFLGHPTHSLTTVSLVLLLCAGIGSAMAGRITHHGIWRLGVPVMAALLMTVIACGLVSQSFVRILAGASTPVRIAAAVALLAPVGFVLGTAFPIGMQLVRRIDPDVAPFLWTVNGGVSSIAAVLAWLLALAVGVSTVYWLGVGCYGVAAVALWSVATTPASGTAAAVAVAGMPDS